MWNMRFYIKLLILKFESIKTYKQPKLKIIVIEFKYKTTH